jgi:hypothetical protein
MKRRDFVAASLAASAASTCSALAPLAAHAQAPKKAPAQQFYELRLYSFKAGASTAKLDDFLRDAAIPAWNRIAASLIGAFTPRDAGESPELYILIPHASLEVFLQAPARLQADAEFQKAAAPYFDSPAKEAAFGRYESSLMRAFAGMPTLELPAFSKEKKPRLFELRTYESHNEKAALKKIEMFNNGEIDIMRRVGLGPVFYGEMLLGARLPNLTYMLSAQDNEAHQQHWKNFIGDAEWKKISAIPEYSNERIVSKITSKFLVPTAYSQI